MLLDELFEKIDGQEFEGVGVKLEEPPSLLIKHKRSALVTRVPVAGLKDLTWPVLADILAGKREPRALQHMTRVIGYYSYLRNFNPSKIGEVKDRIKGNYGIEGGRSAAAIAEAERALATY